MQLSLNNSCTQSGAPSVHLILSDRAQNCVYPIDKASKRQSEIEKNEEKNEEIKSHRINIDDITMIKVRLQVERDNLKGDAVELTRKLEDEHSLRNDLEDELQRLRKDVDDATMVRVDLERKIETLREELEYNRKVHNEEMEDLKEQIASQVQRQTSSMQIN